MRLTCLYFFAFISGVRSEGSSRIIRPLSHCECGLIKNDFLRIVGGVDADINEFPWTVGLYTHQGCRGQPVCGGTLISSQHVLTAAHCIQPGTLKCASLGDHDVSTTSETDSITRGLRATSLSWRIHEEYFPGNETHLPKHDIGILYLSEPIDFSITPNVRPICLPDPNKYADAKANISAIVAGWGLVGEDQGQSVILQKTNLTTVTNTACGEAYGILGATLRDDHICAYKRGTDACQGDSGGALFSQRPAYLRRDNLPRMEIIGITSFGERCAITGIPGGYTRVNHYLKWIMTKMTDHDSNVAEVCNGTFGTWILWFLGQ